MRKIIKYLRKEHIHKRPTWNELYFQLLHLRVAVTANYRNCHIYKSHKFNTQIARKICQFILQFSKTKANSNFLLWLIKARLAVTNNTYIGIQCKIVLNPILSSDYPVAPVNSCNHCSLKFIRGHNFHRHNGFKNT